MGEIVGLYYYCYWSSNYSVLDLIESYSDGDLIAIEIACFGVGGEVVVGVIEEQVVVVEMEKN